MTPCRSDIRSAHHLPREAVSDMKDTASFSFFPHQPHADVFYILLAGIKRKE